MRPCVDDFLTEVRCRGERSTRLEVGLRYNGGGQSADSEDFCNHFGPSNICLCTGTNPLRFAYGDLTALSDFLSAKDAGRPCLCVR